MEYIVQLERDTTGSYLVTCVDFPEFASVGDDESEALANAVDGLETALEIYIEERREIPKPRKAKKGDLVVRLPAQAAAKALLHNEMIRQGIRKSDLGRRLGLKDAQIARLLDMRHSTKLETLEAAIEAVGRHLTICVA